ncbi:MAG TPA: DUF302 domain-containing protein [Candidatus Rubrimentiphilum sp.]|nr:DUF302 domain-containing protein [Candidatus Rubrimentiphilum sp.]
MIPYGKAVAVDLPFDVAVERVKSLLADEGFGVLCDIDVTKTLHEKIGADFRPYRILGACNPSLALQGLGRESQLGLLLPCNIVIQRENEQTIVSAVDTRSLLSLVGNPELEPIAEDVNARLQHVLEGIAEVESPASL